MAFWSPGSLLVMDNCCILTLVWTCDLSMLGGDVLYLTAAPGDVSRITPYNPEFHRQLTLAERVSMMITKSCNRWLNDSTVAFKKAWTMPNSIKQTFRDKIEPTQDQRAFIARGLAAREEAARTGSYVDADVVLDRLEQILIKAKSKS